MKLILQRKSAGEDGIFGELIDVRFKFLFCTLERAYKDKKGVYRPKVKPGKYTCHRTKRTLEKDPEKRTEEDWFWTFEILNVKGHSGILFHVGNYNENSDGCVLLGKGMGRRGNGGRMITWSKQGFAEFMKLLEGIDEFELIVEGWG